MYAERKKSHCVALIDGHEVKYDLCHATKTISNLKGFKYIGRGIIYKVNDVRQAFTEQMYFWIYK